MIVQKLETNVKRSVGSVLNDVLMLQFIGVFSEYLRASVVSGKFGDDVFGGYRRNSIPRVRHYSQQKPL